MLTLTSLRERLIKTGARLVHLGRHDLFRWPPPPAPAKCSLACSA